MHFGKNFLQLCEIWHLHIDTQYRIRWHTPFFEKPPPLFFAEFCSVLYIAHTLHSA